MPRPLYNGFINVVDKVAYYKCNIGFIISDTSYTTGRKCTKASMWEGNLEPYCESKLCVITLLKLSYFSMFFILLLLFNF